MSPQDTLRLVGEAIVEAAALDGEWTAIDAQVRDGCGMGARAWLDIAIGIWFATTNGTGTTPDDAVTDCLRALDTRLARRFPDDTTRRVRAALAAALEAP